MAAVISENSWHETFATEKIKVGCKFGHKNDRKEGMTSGQRTQATRQAALKLF